LSSKNCSTAAPASPEKLLYASTTTRRASSQEVFEASSATGAKPVEVLEPVETEQLRLEAVVALGHVVARRGRVDQRLHGDVGGLVGEVA